MSAAPSSRALLRRVGLVALLFGLLFLGLALLSDVRAMLHALASMSVTAFLVALALATGNYALRFARWHYYLHRLDVKVPLGESALVFLAGFVMSVTPGKVGEVLKSLLLAESRGTPIARTAPIVVAERLTDLVALVTLTGVGAAAVPGGVRLTIGAAAGVALLLAAVGYRPFGLLCLKLAAKLPLLRRIEPRLHEAYDSLRDLVAPRALVLASLLAIASWGLEAVALWVLVTAFPGSHLTWDGASFAYGAATLVGAAAMLPGGLLVTEAGMTGVLMALGVSRAVASASTILVRLATLWWAVAIGAVALVVFRARVARQGVPTGSAPP